MQYERMIHRMSISRSTTYKIVHRHNISNWVMTLLWLFTYVYASSNSNPNFSSNYNVRNRNVNIIEDLRVALCGGLAGATGTALLYPFDTAKTLRQSQPLVYKNVGNALKSFYKHSSDTPVRQWIIRGTRLAYSGVWTSTLGAIPSSAMYFGGYEFAKRRLEQIFLSNVGSCLQNDENSLLSRRKRRCDGNAPSIAMLPVQKRLCIHALAAATGNAISSLIFVPKEYIKQQMQSQCRGLESSSLRAFKGPFTSVSALSSNGSMKSKTMHDMIFEVVQSKGISELYSGYRATLMRNIPSAILRFALYEELKLRLLNNGVSDCKVNESSSSPAFFLAGLAAGTTASAIMTPFDVIKTRLATHTIPGDVTTVIGTARAIISENGISALYAGVGARMLWSGMFSAIGFGTFEHCKQHLFVSNDREV